MCAGLVIALATATLGVDVGWRPAGDGGLEFIIQVEPQLLDTLKDGGELTAGVHPHLQKVRRYRIIVGEGRPPRIDLPEEKPAAAEPPPKLKPEAAEPSGATETPPLKLKPEAAVPEPAPSPPPVGPSLQARSLDQAKEPAPPATVTPPAAIPESPVPATTVKPPAAIPESPAPATTVTPPAAIPESPAPATTVTPPAATPESAAPVEAAASQPMTLPEIPDVQPMEEQIKAVERLWGKSPVVLAKPVDRNVVPASATSEIHPATPPVAGDETADDTAATEAAAATPSETQAAPVVADSPARPWTALVAVVIGLFGSLGLNVYLGWSLSEIRRRYRRLVHRQVTPAG